VVPEGFYVFVKTLRILTFHTSFHRLHYYGPWRRQNRSRNNGWPVRVVNSTDVMIKRRRNFSHK